MSRDGAAQRGCLETAGGLPRGEVGEPLLHGRPFAHRHERGRVLEAQQLGGSGPQDLADLGLGQQLLGTDKVGDPPRTGSGRAPPEPLDRMETGGRTRLDEHDEAQAPGRQGADLVGLDGAAEELCRH